MIPGTVPFRVKLTMVGEDCLVFVCVRVIAVTYFASQKIDLIADRN